VRKKTIQEPNCRALVSNSFQGVYFVFRGKKKIEWEKEQKHPMCRIESGRLFFVTHFVTFQLLSEKLCLSTFDVL